LHPPSCPSPEPGTEIPEDTGARRHLKACPPEALQPRGVEVRTKLKSRTSPREAARRKIRSSPVYAGHAIKPLINLRFSRAPAVSDRIEARRMTERPCPHSTGTKVPLPFERPCGRPEGIVSYGLGCTEYEHRRASDRQHVRRRLFIRSRPACQEQKSGRCEPDARAEIGVNPEIPAQNRAELRWQRPRRGYPISCGFKCCPKTDLPYSLRVAASSSSKIGSSCGSGVVIRGVCSRGCGASSERRCPLALLKACRSVHNGKNRSEAPALGKRHLCRDHRSVELLRHLGRP